MSTTTAAMTDQQLSEIVERHRERMEFRDHIPSGPYFYDSLGYVHNELALRKPGNRGTLKAPGILVRSHEWFKSVNMDARLTKADREIGSDLGQYVALTLDHDVEQDVAALLEEVKRLRVATER